MEPTFSKARGWKMCDCFRLAEFPEAAPADHPKSMVCQPSKGWALNHQGVAMHPHETIRLFNCQNSYECKCSSHHVIQSMVSAGMTRGALAYKAVKTSGVNHNDKHGKHRCSIPNEELLQRATIRCRAKGRTKQSEGQLSSFHYEQPTQPINLPSE